MPRKALAAAAILFLLPLLMFWNQTIGGRTLLPTENLYQYLPYAADREQVGAPVVPHNALLSDLVLQNAQWKSFIRASIAQGEFPLWNPHQLGGSPFFAAGQASTLYPLNLLYYVLPLTAAYGWFTVVQLWIAGLCMAAFVRGLRVGWAGALLAGVIYQLSAVFVTSAVFPMILAGASYIPLLLLAIEKTIRRDRLFGRASVIPWIALGATAIGLSVLAGHVEIVLYMLLIAGYYSVVRLVVLAWHERAAGGRAIGRALFGRAVALLVIVVLGIALGAIQFLPLVEYAQTNFRDAGASYNEVIDWAHPARDVFQMVMPNIHGNAAQHTYFDIFDGRIVDLTVTPTRAVDGSTLTTIDWGMKNSVETALYVGILPMALAVYGLIARTRRREDADSDQAESAPPYRAILAGMGALALSFMFGLPTYAIIYYGVPGANQLHSPFRWAIALALAAAVLAAIGLDALIGRMRDRLAGGRFDTLARAFGVLLISMAISAALTVLIIREFYPSLEPLFIRAIDGLALAPRAFSDARMFASVLAVNLASFSVMTAVAGGVFAIAGWGGRRTANRSEGGRLRLPEPAARQSRWPRVLAIAAVGVAALDLMIASWGFNPASDPAWWDFEPPAIAWLRAQEGAAADWRYTTIDDPNQPPLFQANMTLRYGLHDLRGYDSIITRALVDHMQTIAPQIQLDYNRIAPIYTTYTVPAAAPFDPRVALESPLLDQAGVRYVVSHTTTNLEAMAGYALAYEDDAVRIWENAEYIPRVSLQFDANVRRDMTIAEDPNAVSSAVIVSDTGREMLIEVRAGQPMRLVISGTALPGWRAFVRPLGADESQEFPIIEIERLDAMRQSIGFVNAGDYLVRWVYSPPTFTIGLFGSFVGAAVIAFLLLMWAWRTFVAPRTDGAEGAAGRVARNSLAPIALNLFNRGIDFAFAFVMLRVLGPEGSGLYTYVVVIFAWFDILTNFGLNLYLTREVSIHRARAAHLFQQTTWLRLGLVVIGVPFAAALLGVRQAAIAPALPETALIALGLLYIGLLPGTINTGYAALFYAFERAEIPAAVGTAATICKALFGLTALLLGAGVVGLAAVSILTNIVTLILLRWNARAILQSDGIDKTGGSPTRPYESTQPEVIVAQRAAMTDRPLMRRMAIESWPLMLNHLLATIFFQIDVVIIEAVHGGRMVGQYGVAYKWLTALNIIPSFFTQALLPMMARQAQDDRDGLRRNVQFGIKLLFGLALPIAVAFTFLADGLTALLGGAQFLPDGAIATRLMIWSIPIGWINSLVQYVLIALGVQRRITRAFVIAVGFNIVTNVLLIPPYGYRAAALTTIASELLLLVMFARMLFPAFGWDVRAWIGLVWRPTAAAVLMAGVTAALWPIVPLAALVIGGAAYGVALFGLRAFSEDEIGRAAGLLPAGVRGRFTRWVGRAA